MLDRYSKFFNRIEISGDQYLYLFILYEISTSLISDIRILKYIKYDTKIYV